MSYRISDRPGAPVGGRNFDEDPLEAATVPGQHPSYAPTGGAPAASRDAATISLLGGTRPLASQRGPIGEVPPPPPDFRLATAPPPPAPRLPNSPYHPAAQAPPPVITGIPLGAGGYPLRPAKMVHVQDDAELSAPAQRLIVLRGAADRALREQEAAEKIRRRREDDQ